MEVLTEPFQGREKAPKVIAGAPKDYWSMLRNEKRASRGPSRRIGSRLSGVLDTTRVRTATVGRSRVTGYVRDRHSTPHTGR